MFPPPRARWADDLTLSAQVLAGVRAPVLLIHGAEDRATPLRAAPLPLLEHLADVRLHVPGRCGHVPAVEHPHDFRRLLSDFLRRGPQGRHLWKPSPTRRSPSACDRANLWLRRQPD